MSGNYLVMMLIALLFNVFQLDYSSYNNYEEKFIQHL